MQMGAQKTSKSLYFLCLLANLEMVVAQPVKLHLLKKITSSFLRALAWCVPQILIEKGKILHIKMLAKGHVTSQGNREVFFEVHGQLRSVAVKDKEALKVRTTSLMALTPFCFFCLL